MLDSNAKVTRKVFLKRAGLGAVGLLVFGSVMVANTDIRVNREEKKHSSGTYNKGVYGY